MAGEHHAHSSECPRCGHVLILNVISVQPSTRLCLLFFLEFHLHHRFTLLLTGRVYLWSLYGVSYSYGTGQYTFTGSKEHDGGQDEFWHWADRRGGS
jgi:hypothetical protein